MDKPFKPGKNHGLDRPFQLANQIYLVASSLTLSCNSRICRIVEPDKRKDSVSSQLAAPVERNTDVVDFKNLVPFGFGMHYDFFRRLTFLIIFCTA